MKTVLSLIPSFTTVEFPLYTVSPGLGGCRESVGESVIPFNATKSRLVKFEDGYRLLFLPAVRRWTVG